MRPQIHVGLLKFAHDKGVSPDDLNKAGIVMPSSYGAGPYARFGGRVIFPIIDQTARILGFGGRILEGDGAKYVNSPDTAVYHKKPCPLWYISGKISNKTRAYGYRCRGGTWMSSPCTRRE